MIPSLFAFRFTRRLPELLLIMGLAFLTGALAVYMYTPERLDDLRYLRGEMPELFTLLGIEGDSSLDIHLMGILYGALLPLFMILFQGSAACRLAAMPLQDGGMAMLLSAGHRRSAVLLTLYLNLLAETALVLLACAAGQAILALILFQGFSLLALLRLCLGFFPVMLPYGAFALLMSMQGVPCGDAGYSAVHVCLQAARMDALPALFVPPDAVQRDRTCVRQRGLGRSALRPSSRGGLPACRPPILQPP